MVATWIGMRWDRHWWEKTQPIAVVQQHDEPSVIVDSELCDGAYCSLDEAPEAFEPVLEDDTVRQPAHKRASREPLSDIF